MSDADEVRRARNRERMRKVREAFKRKKKCRTCGKKVVKSPRTGRPSRYCGKHLIDDRARKTPPELKWEDDWAWADTKEYRLAWEP